MSIDVKMIVAVMPDGTYTAYGDSNGSEGRAQFLAELNNVAAGFFSVHCVTATVPSATVISGTVEEGEDE